MKLKSEDYKKLNTYSLISWPVLYEFLATFYRIFFYFISYLIFYYISIKKLRIKIRIPVIIIIFRYVKELS